jgi:acetyltransferase-like isoleucine patch superfamily enzyme
MAYLRKKYRLSHVDPTFYMAGKTSVCRDLYAEEYSYIGPNCFIYPKVRIGAYTMLANNVSIIGNDHQYKKAGIPVVFSGREDIKETVIGKDVWIGAYSIIKLGVKIGNGTVVAMGSVVTKDLEPFSIYGGNPAKKIKDRFETEEEKKLHIEMLTKSASECGFGFEMLCKDKIHRQF